MCVKVYLGDCHKILGYWFMLTLKLVCEAVMFMGDNTRSGAEPCAVTVQIRHVS